MGALNTFESSDTGDVYAFLTPQITNCKGEVACYSRLPMRQLLRYIPSNLAEMWWLTDREDQRAVTPDIETLDAHVNGQLGPPGSLLIVEGLDWLASRSGEEVTLAWLQRLDAAVRERDIDVVLPVDPLSLSVHFWRRLSGLAPLLEQPMTARLDAVDDDGGHVVEVAETDTMVDIVRANERVLTHLVSLPLAGFNKTLLAKRMLQWKRMGLDLSALEPALSMNDMQEVHAVYAAVETDIRLAIDGLRLIEHHNGMMSVSEREMFNYRMMSLTDVVQHVQELEHVISTR